MNIPLVFCGFKTELRTKLLQYNKAYIVKLEDEFDENGLKNEDTHYTCFQVNRYPNGRKQGVYFDSFWQPPTQIVDAFVGFKWPYNTKDIQSLMNSACGRYCHAFLHFITPIMVVQKIYIRSAQSSSQKNQLIANRLVYIRTLACYFNPPYKRNV